MITSSDVKGRVVDITKAAAFPPRISIDANVLFFVNYPNFHDLEHAGGQIPWQYRKGSYAAWLKRALGAGTKLFTSVVTMGEFVRTVEHAELEILWRTDPNNAAGMPFTPRDCKLARYSYAPRLPKIRADVATILTSVRKLVDLLPKPASSAAELNAAMAKWQGSHGDFADSILVATADSVAISDILSDDVDLATFDGLTIYTANASTTQAASAAGRLIR